MGHRNVTAALERLGALRTTHHRPTKVYIWLASRTYDLPQRGKPARTYWGGLDELVDELYLNPDRLAAANVIGQGAEVIRQARMEAQRDLRMLKNRGLIAQDADGTLELRLDLPEPPLRALPPVENRAPRDGLTPSTRRSHTVS